MERRAGFEPATSRLTDEVTAIFTTDRDWLGGEQSMLYCPCGHRFGDEVTDIFTTAGPVQAPAIDGYAGERAISVSVTSTQVLSLSAEPEPATQRPCGAASTVRDAKGGIRTRSFHVAKYPKSSPPASVWPQDAANRNEIVSFAARERCAAVANLQGFALSSVSGSSPSFPPTGPALAGTRLSGVSPGIRVSRSGFAPGYFKRALLRTIKNPPERLAREGPWSGLSISPTRDRSHEPGVRYRPAQSRSIVGR